MKSIWLHGIYLFVIGVLFFQLWSRAAATEGAFSQVANTFKYRTELSEEDNKDKLNTIEKETMTNITKYGQSLLASKRLDSVTKVLITEISKKDIDYQILRKKVEDYSHAINSGISSTETDALSKKSLIKKLLATHDFWACFKNHPLAFKTMLKQQILDEELLYLNYYLDKVSGRMICNWGPMYRACIAPKKATLIEGEKFEADIYLATYEAYPSTAISYIVGNDTLSLKDGVAHYTKREKTAGLKSVKVKAIKQNPATGEINTYMSTFEYHVLPKCSENCQ